MWRFQQLTPLPSTPCKITKGKLWTEKQCVIPLSASSGTQGSKIMLKHPPVTLSSRCKQLGFGHDGWFRLNLRCTQFCLDLWIRYGDGRRWRRRKWILRHRRMRLDEGRTRKRIRHSVQDGRIWRTSLRAQVVRWAVPETQKSTFSLPGFDVNAANIGVRTTNVNRSDFGVSLGNVPCFHANWWTTEKSETNLSSLSKKKRESADVFFQCQLLRNVDSVSGIASAPTFIPPQFPVLYTFFSQSVGKKLRPGHQLSKGLWLWTWFYHQVNWHSGFPF